MSSKAPPKKSIATRSVRAGLESDAQHGSVVPPIYLSTNFAFEKYRKPRKYDYTRSGNPTRDQLGDALADLEGGAGAVVTCTGLSAITLILATLPGGARVIAPYDCYGGTYRLLSGPACAGQPGGRLHRSGRRRRPAGGSRSRRRPGVDRDAEQSLAAGGRHPRDRRCGACGRRIGGRRQYLSLADLAAAAQARRRPGHAFDHQVLERPQRRGRRRGHRGHARSCTRILPGGPMPSASPARRSTAS